MEHYLKILFDEDVYIPSDIDVHHINGNKMDNSLINLEFKTRSDHTIHHNRVDMTDRFCSNCKSTTTYIKKKNGHPEWIRDGKGGWLCNKCRCRKYRNENL